jgi:hypothetical protein
MVYFLKNPIFSHTYILLENNINYILGPHLKT